MNRFFLIILLFAFIVSCTSNEETAPSSAENINPLLIGQQIPDVILKNASGMDVDLHKLVSEQKSLILFYRGGWCPFCNSQLSQISNIEDELYNKDVQIIAISPDRPQFLEDSLTDQELGYTLLSDSDMSVSKKFGIAFKVDPAEVASLKENNMDIEQRSGHDHHLLPVPAIFLVDTDGTIHFQYVNPDYKVRPGDKVLLAAVDELIEKQAD